MPLSAKTECLPSTPDEKADHQPAWLDTLKKSIGTHSSEAAMALLKQASAGAFRPRPNQDQQLCAVCDIFSEMAPKDPLESMLCVQMIAVHFQASELMRQATMCSLPETCQSYLNLATKLMRTYGRQMDTFRKNRLKGRQEIRVEHINITGGQNIVGTVNHEGGGGNRNGKSS
jgi:hypothetical protein